MKQKTIGLNPLEEYLSGKKTKKEQPDSAPETAPKLHAEAPVSEEPLETKSPEVQVTLTLDEPLSIDNSLSGQLTIDDSVGGKPPTGKQRITLHISAEIVDRVKNAVYWEPGLTVAGFAEEALEKALADMEAERGKPFPQRRQHRLRGGRPII